MRFYLSILSFFLFFSVFAQEEVVETKVVDSLYREDQFYFGITYNILQNLPTGITKSKFSPGISVGFLRDMPINKNRTFSIAIGVGYSLSVLRENMYTYDLPDSNGVVTRTYEVLSADSFYDKNKQTLSYIDVPLEIRWRASTPESHKFWRIYSGFKVSYLIGDRYKFINDVQTITIKNNADLNKLQYGCYLAVGWNSVNFYAYYSLNPIFKSTTQLAGQPIKMNTLNVGFMFYIL